MARTKSFVNLKNKLKPEVQVRKKTRVQPLKTNKKSLSDSSNTQNTDGTLQPKKNDSKLKMIPKVVVSKISHHFEDYLKKIKRKKKVTFSVQDLTDLKRSSRNRKMTVVKTSDIVMSNYTNPQEKEKTCWQISKQKTNE